MEGKDHIKDLFSEKLGQLEVPVRPELWSAVSSQIGAAAPVAGLSVISKMIIGVSVAASVSVGVYLVTREKEPIKEQQEISAQQESIKDPTTNFNQGIDPSEKAPLFNKIVEFPSDEEFEEKDELVVVEEENLETRVLFDEQVDVKEQLDNQTDSQFVPANDGHKQEQSTKQEAQNVDTKAEETIEAPQVVESKHELVLFNTFTPNNDGVNDELKLNTEGLTDFNLVVLDRSNEVVYQTNDPNFRWNGYGLNNEMVPSGKYVYYVTAKDVNGCVVSKYSPLEIIR